MALLHVDAVDPRVTLLLMLDAVGTCVLLMRRCNEVAVVSAAVLVTVCVQPGIVPFIWGRRQFVLFKVIFQELLQRLSALYASCGITMCVTFCRMVFIGLRRRILSAGSSGATSF